VFRASHPPGHPQISVLLNNIAWLCKTQGKFAEAAKLYEHLHEEKISAFGPNHLEVAIVIDERAWVANALGRPTDAIALYKKAIAMRETCLGDPNAVELASSIKLVFAFLILLGIKHLI